MDPITITSIVNAAANIARGLGTGKINWVLLFILIGGVVTVGYYQFQMDKTFRGLETAMQESVTIAKGSAAIAEESMTVAKGLAAAVQKLADTAPSKAVVIQNECVSMSKDEIKTMQKFLTAKTVEVVNAIEEHGKRKLCKAQ